MIKRFSLPKSSSFGRSAWATALFAAGLLTPLASGADLDEVQFTLLFQSDNRGYVEECG